MSRIIFICLSQKEIKGRNNNCDYSNTDRRRNIRVPVMGNLYCIKVIIIITAFACHRLFRLALRLVQLFLYFHTEQHFFICYVIAIRAVNIVVIIRNLIPAVRTCFHDLPGTVDIKTVPLSPSPPFSTYNYTIFLLFFQLLPFSEA